MALNNNFSAALNNNLDKPKKYFSSIVLNKQPTKKHFYVKKLLRIIAYCDMRYAGFSYLNIMPIDYFSSKNPKIHDTTIHKIVKFYLSNFLRKNVLPYTKDLKSLKTAANTVRNDISNSLNISHL